MSAAPARAIESEPSSPEADAPITSRQPTVLVVDDDRDMCELAEAGMGLRGYGVTWRTAPSEALAAIEDQDFDVVLVDIHMDGMNGLELCRQALAKRPNLAVVVMTGFGSLEHAIGAMRAGAYDFITKPVSIDALALTIGRAARHRAMAKELQWLRRHVSSGELPRLVGDSPAMRKVGDLVNRVADSDANVLITGESGTGKELIARALHEQSGRQGPFLAINCAALPETLLESELFGHVRGAFTDARSARAGLFVEADAGTLFLDEIGDMPLGMQAKLLRALQERKVRPLGSSREVPFSARLVTATNRDLEAEVSHNRFREDLYYRVNVVRIDVPPLRARGNDVLQLAQSFVQRFAERGSRQITGIDRSAAELLISYHWPGNVRELQNCLERAIALSRFNEITPEDLPAKIREYCPSQVLSLSEDTEGLLTMREVEQRYIRKVLNLVGDNRTVAAKVLGFDRRTLYRKLARAPS